MPENMKLFTSDELKQYRYKCSHKLAVSLTVGAIYLLGLTVFFLNKALHNVPDGQDRLQYYGIAAAVYFFLVFLFGLIVRRSHSLNFSRFLNGCVRFDKFELMLEYVELRMPSPFSPRFLKYPVHLMILGKVLEHSEKPENVEAGHRMVAAAADRDPALEPFREAELADLMKYHETFLAAHSELVQEWRNAESFHTLLVHLILPVVIIVSVILLVLKGCDPPEQTEERSLPSEQTRTEVSADASATGEAQNGTAADAAESESGERSALNTLPSDEAAVQ